jgi:hypothetical protein
VAIVAKSTRRSFSLEVDAFGRPIVWTAGVSHRHGDDVYVAQTEAGAKALLREYCQEWAQSQGVDLAGVAEDDIIDTYFDASYDESYTLCQSTLEVDVPHKAAADSLGGMLAYASAVLRRMASAASGLFTRSAHG